MSAISTFESFVVPYTEPNDHNSTRYVCLVRIVDSDGHVGWGEAAVLFPAAAFATEALLQHWRGLLCGVPASSAEVFDLLRKETWWYGDSGIACFARSAIDLALWDLAGQRVGLSLPEMLGQANDSLPILLSCHATMASIHEMATSIAESVRTTKASGVKVGFGKRGDARLGYDTARDIMFVRELRNALGPVPTIMIDIGAAIDWSLNDAQARLEAFAELAVDWLEEPLGARHPDYTELHRWATAHGNTARIAFGEREWSPAGYAEIIASGAVDVVGIDPGRALGVTGFRETTTALESAGVQGNAHAFTGPVIFGASLGLSLASSAFQQLELMPRRNTLYELADEFPIPLDGAIQAARRPGFGVSLSVERVRMAAISR